MAKVPLEDRVFVQNGRRHYRRRYSMTEVRTGALVVVGLLAVGGWVVYRGAHPDPELFATVVPTGEAGSAGSVDRGPLPDGIAPDGWREASLSKFDASNLYEKINGREGYYKAFGFRFLYFVSLQKLDDPEVAVDIELYDLGEANNAIGAFAGEMPDDAEVSASANGLSYRTPNALFMVRGSNYVRALGSSADPVIDAAVDHLSRRFNDATEGGALPWAYALFVGALGVGVGDVAYQAENAFSFGFARAVFTARRTEDMQLFVHLADDEASARRLVERFQQGFTEIGEGVAGPAGERLAKDRFLGGLSTVSTAGRLVVGVHGAPDVARALAELTTLSDAASEARFVARLPEKTKDESGVEVGAGQPPQEGEAEGASAYDEAY